MSVRLISAKDIRIYAHIFYTRSIYQFIFALCRVARKMIYWFLSLFSEHIYTYTYIYIYIHNLKPNITKRDNKVPLTHLKMSLRTQWSFALYPSCFGLLIFHSMAYYDSLSALDTKYQASDSGSRFM